MTPGNKQKTRAKSLSARSDICRYVSNAILKSIR